jgi:uncharacterized protein DUF1488
MAVCDGMPKPRREAIEFVLREGQIEIRCSVSYDALRRQAGVVELNEERARRLFNWYRHQLERIALARYAAGDFRGGEVVIDRDDIAPLANRRLAP